MKYDVERFKELYNGSISGTARLYAQEKGIEYTDSLRRHFSKKLKGEKLHAKQSEEEFTKINKAGDNAVYEAKAMQLVTTEEDAIKYFNIDTEKWAIDKFVCGTWGSESNPCSQFKLFLKKREYLSEEKAIDVKNTVLQNSLKFDVPDEDYQMWVVIGCVHRPFHDKKSWKAFLSFLKDHKKNIYGFIINGDYLDLRTLSSHDEGCVMPDNLTLSDEYADGLQGLLEIKKVLGNYYAKIKKVFHYGNHEDRWGRHIRQYKNSHYGKALQSPKDGLRLDELEYQVIESFKNGYTTIGNKLDVYHGDSTSATPCKAMLQRLPNRSHLFNHTHRTGYHSNGENTAYNGGWMGDEKSGMFDYMTRASRNAWQQAFTVAYIDAEGNHNVNIIEINNGKFFFGGKLYV